MKNKIFYPKLWQTLPYSISLIDKIDERNITPIKDLALNSNYVFEKGISEMKLNVQSFFAIDKDGNEHKVEDFRAQTLNLKGDYTGLYIEPKNGLKLNPGMYTHFKFYLNAEGGNKAILTDRSEVNLVNADYVDFVIENGLVVKEDKAIKIRMSFNFSPFTYPNFSKLKKDILNNYRLFTNKKVNSFQS
ncbi:hypothetical protein [Winogradskyella pulchriflava]|uniref:Uncharacterized protein n=1 Tax=Winogradskyella pulchriflava TaxID=1110688 RepID=A0ABV6Q728_9FLAO